ncbi:MAG: ATP-binding protein [Acidobacteria bacterium]|nr:ATP-binding protein [Acidobacteriota bacterium]
MTDQPSDKRPEPMPLLVFKGRRAKASYLPQEITGYRGNPFIEALPPILTEDEVIEALAYYPNYDEAERRLPSHLRLHLIQSALQLFAPLPIHLDLERRFSRMIRASYQQRNPLSRDFWRDVVEGIEALESSTTVVGNRPRPSPLGFTIIGFPGVGKSTSVESVVSLYPQVIYHSHYGDRDFTHAQIVWLKLECPHDGSIKGLCLNFFQAIDDILGTNYEANYAGGRRTVDEMLPQMARVAANHGLGVLVIDEIQRLSHAKSGGGKRMLNFFVQVANTIGVPVVLVGTYAAKAILSGEFHQIRRGTGQGDLVWDRMEEEVWSPEKDKKSKPGVWQLFLESLWTYQYVRNACPLTEELSHVLYEETQGITDFAAKVYMLAQVRAIVSGEEVITARIIRSVARDSLRQAQKVLDALRRGDINSVTDIEDIHPIRIDDYIKQAQKQLPRTKRTAEAEGATEAHPEISVTTSDTPQPPQTDVREAAPKPRRRKPRRDKKSGAAAFEKGDLRGEAADGVESGTPANESLQKAGLIQSANEFLDEEAA